LHFQKIKSQFERNSPVITKLKRLHVERISNTTT
jgi:hypothetical protein